MKSTLIMATMILVAVFMSGCAQVMAFKQPKPYAPTSLASGAKRLDVIAELGQPASSEEHSGLLTDSYRYVDGGSKNNGGSKTTRIILYTAGDLFTIFLDQVIWMPTEKFGFSG